MNNNYSEVEKQILPTSVPTERTILGAMLSEASAISEAIGELSETDFSLDSHQRIFRAITTLANAGGSVDYVTVREELTRRKELDSIGGFDYLLSLTEGIPRKFSIENYVRIVRNKSILREIAKFSVQLSAEAADDSEQGTEIATWGVSRLSEIMANGQTRDSVTGPAEMARSAEERLINKPSSEGAISTGIDALDEMTGGGIRLGDLWVIGAAPSRGKTTLARQFVKSWVWKEIACYVHSGEMSKESWFDVTACLLEGMQHWKIREPQKMDPFDKERLLNGIRDLSKMPLYLSDTGGIHIDRLIWNSMQCILRHNAKISVYDYAQIIKAAGDDKQKVSTVAHRLRQHHKDTNTAGVLLSQSPRPEGRAINARPTMFSLKESGSLEEAAHVVILPYRPIDQETGKWTGEDELIIGKNRWGALGSIPVYLNGAYLRFDAR